MTDILKRLEAWASHSPERTRLLTVVLIAMITAVAVISIAVMAWLALGTVAPDR